MSNQFQVSPFEEESIDEMQETDDVTQEILTDSDEPFYAASIPKQFSQSELNDVVRDFFPSKMQQKLLLLCYKNKTTNISYI